MSEAALISRSLSRVRESHADHRRRMASAGLDPDASRAEHLNHCMQSLPEDMRPPLLTPDQIAASRQQDREWRAKSERDMAQFIASLMAKV